MYNFIIESIFGKKEVIEEKKEPLNDGESYKLNDLPKVVPVSASLNESRLHGELLTVIYSDKSEEQYRYGYFDWFRYPMMTRVSNSTEITLNDYVRYIRFHNGNWPDAHLKGGK